MDEQTNLVPEWMEGKKINESLFCREYLQEHPMIAISGTFFTVDGRVTDEAKLSFSITFDVKVIDVSPTCEARSVQAITMSWLQSSL